MINFWKSLAGLVALTTGVILFIWITKRRINGDKGGYGGHINIYTGALILFFIGLIMLIEELMKL
jgi:hypothetical protein